MLIRFRVKNFLSFKEEVEFSMIPGLSRQHAAHIMKEEGKNKIDILRGAVIYGANASGKSNLIKAIEFAKELIVTGTKSNQRINVKPFKLEKCMQNELSKFEFEFFKNGNYYLYGFELNYLSIKNEWLYKINKTSEKLLFERNTKSNGISDLKLGIKVKAKEKEFLNFVARGTRQNQLYLTEAKEKNVNYFSEILDWFTNLIVIFPNSKFSISPYQVETGGELIREIVSHLKSFDTGICDFELIDIPIRGEIPDSVISELQSVLEKGTDSVFYSPAGQYYLAKMGEDQEIHVRKLMFKHYLSGCDEQVLFSMSEESDGTLRLIDLIPALIDEDDNEEEVYVIDELDRSLHPSLCYKFMQSFLTRRNPFSQLIVSTHESELLDMDLLRRDEIWFVEKDNSGASSIYSLEEFAPRYDKDIQKGYLLGRFGAIPAIKGLN